ncbi:MAG: glutathione S-transferase family protein [Burkholderiaceae bacterium]
MKLYMVPLAPNPTKVMLYLAEREALGQPLPVEQIVVNTLKGRHREPEHLARNPFGTLPVLELDDGSHLFESLAIIQYLEDRFADGALAAAQPEARAHAANLERTIELRLANPIGQFVHATRSPLGLPADPVRASQLEAAVQAPLDFLERLLGDGRALMTGVQPAIADCTLAAALQFMRFAGADLLGERVRLRAWDTRYRERPPAKTVLRW